MGVAGKECYIVLGSKSVFLSSTEGVARRIRTGCRSAFWDAGLHVHTGERCTGNGGSVCGRRNGKWGIWRLNSYVDNVETLRLFRRTAPLMSKKVPL